MDSKTARGKLSAELGDKPLVRTWIDHHDGTQAVDLDHDGDLDIISVGWSNPKIWIYENL